jgi:mRNA interferase MazF
MDRGRSRRPCQTRLSGGQVWWVAFDPSVGGEARKARPPVVVSNDAANRALNRVQVVPLTSKATRVYPAQALITLEGQHSKAMPTS